MIEIVKENPCAECGIKGLYEHCEDKCVQYRKWYQYQQGRADAIDECINKFKQRNCIDTKCKIRECSKCIVYMLMEQLKEHKNELV